MIQNVLFGASFKTLPENLKLIDKYVYLVESGFLIVSKPTKTSNKYHSFYNKVLLKKHHSFYERQLTQHYEKYTSKTQPKTLLALQIFQQKSKISGWYQTKHLHCTFSRCPKTAFSKRLENKCLNIPVNLCKKISVPPEM